MGNVVRIGDGVSCGDFSAQGSDNVFANGMPITHMGQRMTTGHYCFPPSVFISNFSNTVFVNKQPVALKNKTRIMLHICGKRWHDGVAIQGSPDVSIEE
jgi:hypothetical protein